MIRLNISPADTLQQNDWNCLTQSADSWYGTPGNCLLYAHHPSEWMALWRNGGKHLIAACFFSITRCFRVGNHLQLGGPTAASYCMLKELMARKSALILTIPYIKGHRSTESLPWWKGVIWDSSSDWIVDLPSTYADYLKNLGRTSRKHLSSYSKKFQRELPSQLSIVEGPDINQELVAELVELHRRRIQNTDKKFLLTQDKIVRRTRLAHECGLFCGRWVEGRLIGGTLNYFHGSTIYLSLVAHDPKYDDLHCGLVCLLDTIQYLITRGISKYNLHIRYSPFKVRLGGVEQKYHDKIIFANVLVAVLWHSRHLPSRLRSCTNRLTSGSS
jgi:hypothetical protein